MGRKKQKKVTEVSWCWYCDREFEDDKVLIQHQKAKHFRCPHCPRRLNTAGGLAVHIDQVHKLGTDRIENALPGRDSFDFEIYGMEGIPAPDLREWKQQRAEKLGLKPKEQISKRPKILQIALTEEQARVQLAAHKALMQGPAPPIAAGLGAPPAGFPGQPMPPPGFGGAIPPPPPGFRPPNIPGLPAFPAPPPGFQLPPGLPPPPGGAFPPVAGGAPPFQLPPNIPPPPGGFAALAALGIPPPPGGVFPPLGAAPLPGSPFPPTSGAGTPAPGMPGGIPPPGAPTGPAALQGPEEVPSSAVELKPGTMLVYGDNDVSPEEKRARLVQYRVEEEAAVAEVSGGVAGAGVEADGSRKRARAADLME